MPTQAELTAMTDTQSALQSEITGDQTILAGITAALAVANTLTQIQTILADGTGSDNQIQEITALLTPSS